MKILLSILLNACILYIITYLLWPNSDQSIQAWIILWCNDCAYNSMDAIKTYIVWWIILGIINATIRPILKILSLPLFFIFFGLVSFVINGMVLFIFTFIVNNLLLIEGVGYEINGLINFVIAVAIFTVLNTLYSLLFFKR